MPSTPRSSTALSCSPTSSASPHDDHGEDLVARRLVHRVEVEARGARGTRRSARTPRRGCRRCTTLRCWLTVISERSRPSRSQCAASTSSLRGSSSDGDVRFDSSAYWATIRSVFFSPLPPIITGMRADRRRLVDRVVHLVVLAVERRPLVAQHREDDLQRLLELLEPVGERAELEAERVVLELEPAGADAELRPPAGHDVERGDDLGQQRRVAVRVAGDERAEPHVRSSRAPARRASCSTRACSASGGPSMRQLVEVVHQQDGVEAGPVGGRRPGAATASNSPAGSTPG